MSLSPVKTLQELVQIPSLNPMGRASLTDDFLEHRLTDYLQAFFTTRNWRWARQFVATKRENIFARIDGSHPPEQGGPLLVFEAHQDTVPVDGMTIDPFSGELRDGRIYGRGSCDIKGGMAAMLTAAERLSALPISERPNLLLACTVNEEYGFTGARRLASHWESPHDPALAALLSTRPQAVIVAEPTELNVVGTHRGVVRWRCHTLGKASHSSQPERGENAIYRMAQVVRWLETYAKEVIAQLPGHELLGRPTLNVGTIQGGISVNTVPDRCTIEIDRRLIPQWESDPLAVQRAAVEYLTRHVPPEVTMVHDEPYMGSPGLTESRNRMLSERFQAVVRSMGKPCEILGVPYGTDAPAYDAIGIPTIVFGPGSISQAHTADEWLAVEQLESATEAYYRFALEFGREE